MITRRILLWIMFVLVLVALPPLATALGQTYYIDLVRRVLILSIAAISLNLILGYGGLVSFGHAAYLGVGAYAVGILGFYGIGNGWVHILGAVSIRPSSISSSMISLAIAAISLNLILGYGGLVSFGHAAYLGVGAYAAM